MQPIFISDRRRDILLLAFSIISIVVLAGRGIYLLISGLTFFDTTTMVDQASNLFAACGMFFCAGLIVPLLVYCIRTLKGQENLPARLPPVKFGQVAGLMIAWVIILVLGSTISNLSNFAGAISTPFFLVGIAMPIAALAWIAVGGLPTGSRRRLWAAFGIGMTGSTMAAMLLEYMLVGFAALAAGIVIVFNPELRTVFQQIWKQITNAGDVQSLLTTLAPYLTNPLVLLLALLFAAVLAPIIEETLKPAALWLLGKQLHSTAEGFALGALCGAGFAMLEGMQAASGMTQILAIGIAARLTSSLMHITTSALMGWAIASARLEKRYGRLAGIYLLSVSIHGLWNGSVVLAVFGALRLTIQNASTDLLGMILVVTGVGILGSMLVTIMILLPIINRRLRPSPPVTISPSRNDIISPLQS